MPWVAGVLSSCHPSGGVSLVLQILVGARWSSSGHPTGVFLSDCTLSPCLGLALAFWVFHVWVFSGSPSESGWGVLCFRHGWRASLYRPGQREKNCNGRMLYPVGAVRFSWSAWGGASSAVRAVHIATGCSVKVGSSISVSFWLRMPGHGGAGSRSRNGLFCVPWARCTRAVAPCLLCEELAVILVVRSGCGARAHPCEASASRLWPLGSSRPSTRPVGGGAGPGLTRSCSP